MSSRFGTPYDEYIRDQATQALGVPKVETQEGTSGFFSQPSSGLDTRIIASDGDLRDDVREQVLTMLYDFWDQSYVAAEKWSTVWIAGSALSHQFHEHEQPDLDVLIGIDYQTFFEHNPDFRGTSAAVLSDRINDEFRTQLAPHTENFMGEFEATWYVNPGATDIRTINPYAAYNVSADEWTVKPVEVPEDWDPRSYYPTEWWSTLDAEVHNAETLVQQYGTLSERVKNSQMGSIQQTSAVVQLRQITDRVSELFGDIHTKRKKAFSSTGKGYFDYYNLRWQTHKRAGTVKALNEISSTRKRGRAQQSQVLYGGDIDDPETALLKAQLFDTAYGKSAWYRKHLG